MSKLKVDDVVKVKRMLQQKYKHKDIEAATGVSVGNIKSISRGKAWKHIQIDSNGDIIKKEYSPEDYPVYYIDDEINKPDGIDVVWDENTKYKIEFIDNYFEKRIVHAKGDKSVSKTRIEPKERISKNFIFGLWKRFKWLYNDEYDDFISFIMLVVAHYTLTFQPENEDFDWSRINDNGTKENLGLHSYLTKNIKYRVKMYADHINDTYRVQKDGIYHYEKYKPRSTDISIADEGEADIPLIEGLGKDSDVFSLHNDYNNIPFLRFFKENILDILTPNLIEFIHIYKFFGNYQDFPSPYIKGIKEIKNNPYNQNTANKNMEIIRNKAFAAWSNEQDEGKWSIRNNKHKQDLDILLSFMESEDKDKWLLKQLDDSDYISNLIHDNLDVAHLKHMNISLRRGYPINNEVMSEIKRLIEDAILNKRKLIKGDNKDGEAGTNSGNGTKAKEPS